MLLSRRSYILLGGSVILTLALALAAATHLRHPEVTLPEGTAIHVRLDQTIASNRNLPGDQFEATLSEPIIVENKTVIPEGAVVTGVVVDAHPSGHLHGRARLRLALESVEMGDHTYAIQTSSATRVGGGHKRRNIALIAGGGGGGALIGALAAGGKGALIGGPIGAGAGTAVAYFTGKKDVRIPAERSLTFTLAEPVTVRA